MDALLGKISQHAMNYAIRSGIGITASFAISQTTRLLRTVEDNKDYQELQSLQERLDSKIRIISPAIDLIELISARGNTTLESAVTLAKGLRWDIQSLGIRLERAAAAEEISRRKSGGVKSRAAHEVEIRLIVQDIRKLLVRIEDAVPLINLAIATSGASLSTRLPSTVSPSRLLQASTFLTLGDTRYCENPGALAQVGPAFTLSLYMLYGGHASVGNKKKYKDEDRNSDKIKESETNRDPTWKEVIHKARVRLLRIPLDFAESTTLNHLDETTSLGYGGEQTILSEEGSATEFAYELEFIEDLDDDRVHTFDDEEPQPGQYRGVELAGIRESLPIHQIARIFYGDTGKILNIKSQHETNNPVLLLKRDIDAVPPRRMMQEEEKSYRWGEQPEDAHQAPDLPQDSGSDSQDHIDDQIRRESSVALLEQTAENQLPQEENRAWRFPQDLDPEWIALEVYNEPEDFSSEDEQDRIEDFSYTSRQPSSSAQADPRSDAHLAAKLEALNLSRQSSSSVTTPKPTSSPANLSSPPTNTPFMKSTAASTTPFGPIRSSLSLMEMLIRLASLQQFQQASHLSIPDEFLVFFLEESSNTGMGGADERRKARNAARQKMGFDPYDDTPMKRQEEEYHGGDNHWDSAPAQSDAGYEQSPNYYENRRFRNRTPSGWTPSTRVDGNRQTPGTPEPWLPRSGALSPSHPRQEMQDILPSSPVSPYRPVRKSTRPLQRVKQGGGVASPLGRGMSVETDSTLGTSPGSPTLVDRAERKKKKGVHGQIASESE